MSETVEMGAGPEAVAAPEGVSPAVALALGQRSRGAPGKAVDAEAAAFLRDQRRLVNLQSEHLHEQRELMTSRLRWGRFSDRMKAVLQVMTALVGLAVVVGVGAMAWSASQDHSLVVEPFLAPPALAQSGVSGQVVAGDVTDHLEGIDRVIAARGSFSGSTSVSADASDEVKLEIPETGISVTELSRALRRWLGAQRLIEGSLRQTPDGQIRLTAHLAGHESVSASGLLEQLEEIERKVAEQLFAQIDAANWANYLDWSGRRAEALAAMAQLPALAATPAVRGDAYSLWSNHVHDPVISRSLARTALVIDPKLAAPWYEISVREIELGHDEAALAAARRILSSRDQDQAPQIKGAGFRRIRAIANVIIARLNGDFAAEDDRAGRVPGGDVRDSIVGPQIAAALHDGRRAAVFLAEARAAGDRSADVLSVQLDADAAADDWGGAVRDGTQILAIEAQERATASSADDQSGIWWNEQVRDRPRLAEARLRLGDITGAQAAIAPTPLDCYACLRERGRIAAAARDWAGAERWFAEAVRQGPSIPFAYADWGQMLLARGDAPGALAKLRLAHEKGPNWADALELWGEVLVRTGDLSGAAATFAEASSHAPNWGRNHMMWGEALMLSGRYAQARRQYEIAGGLGLSKPDRAALDVLLQRTARGPLHG